MRNKFIGRSLDGGFISSGDKSIQVTSVNDWVCE
jgi:hypothetical protein